MMAMRVFISLAAAFLVLAFGVAVLGPGLSLGELLLATDDSLLASLQDFAGAWLPSGAWLHVAIPLLIRPAWLVPVGCGLVCGGMALNLGSKGKPATRRRRS